MQSNYVYFPLLNYSMYMHVNTLFLTIIII